MEGKHRTVSQHVSNTVTPLCLPRARTTTISHFAFWAGRKGADIYVAFSPGWTPGTPQVFPTCIYQTLLPSGQQHAPTTGLRSICRAISDSKRAFPVGLVKTAVSGLLTKVSFTKRLAKAANTGIKN